MICGHTLGVYLAWLLYINNHKNKIRNIKMSILEVKNLSQGFDDCNLFEDVSFRLLKGEHRPQIGANGRKKNLYEYRDWGNAAPGRKKWEVQICDGWLYLDQHCTCWKRQSVRDAPRTVWWAFQSWDSYQWPLYEKMGRRRGCWCSHGRSRRTSRPSGESWYFYTLDAKIDEVARALGVMVWHGDGCKTFVRWAKRQGAFGKTSPWKAWYLALLDEPTIYGCTEHWYWLTLSPKLYENAFVLISRYSIPQWRYYNIVYCGKSQQLTLLWWLLPVHQEVYAMKKSQLEAAYERQQKEIADLGLFVAH